MAAVDVLDAGSVWAGMIEGAIPAVVDLRSPEDRAAAPFEGPRGVEVLAAALWRVLDEPSAWAERIPDDAVLVCAKGHGAEMVAELLGEEGRRVCVLAGGMEGWGSFLAPQRLSLPGDTRLAAWQLLRPAKGCLSYVIGVPGEGAVVVDPARRAEPYLQVAAAAEMRILAVVDTHLHADHVSGGADLGRITGAPYLLPSAELASGEKQAEGSLPQESADPRWPVPVFGVGDEPASIELCADQQIELIRLHLPGHTPGTTALAVPGVLLAAGDTIFRTGVGRPDLTGQARELAAALYDSIHDRLAGMPAETLLLPAHWSRPEEIGADGTVTARLGDVLGSDTLAGMGRDEFVEAVTASLSAAPESYERIRAVNAGAPADPDELDQLELGRNQCAAGMRTG
jgi:glyoxylase-like metal-dependent hydrolase (beta-lactamase superfamily II)/rhodanese-related sulfurtransferase